MDDKIIFEWSNSRPTFVRPLCVDLLKKPLFTGTFSDFGRDEAKVERLTSSEKMGDVRG